MSRMRSAPSLGTISESGEEDASDRKARTGHSDPAAVPESDIAGAIVGVATLAKAAAIEARAVRTACAVVAVKVAKPSATQQWLRTPSLQASMEFCSHRAWRPLPPRPLAPPVSLVLPRRQDAALHDRPARRLGLELDERLSSQRSL